MELVGQISDIIYQNEINSYTIAILENDEDTITIVGYLPFINNGDTLKINGEFVNHQEYGEQFKIDTFEKLMPQTLESLERYLSNGTIKGIGPSTAKKIVDTFGDDTINVFKFEPKKLSQIKGISETKAIEISKSFIESWELWQIVGFLEKFGIGVSSAKSIYKILGESTIEKIESNPYVLIDIVKGIDFKKIDKIAIDLGIEENNNKRIKSGIKYSLMKISYNGHCCVLKQNLIDFVLDLLHVETQEIENSIIELNVKEEIVLEKRDNEEWIYLTAFYNAEKNIAERIMSINTSKNIKYLSEFNKELKKVEEIMDIELSNKQKDAVKSVNNNNVIIITGGPGTGKTTIIKSIIEIYKLHNMKTVICAPTGRAAKRMTESTGQEAKTLHRLLEIGKIEDDIQLLDKNYDVAPIDADIIIVDEMSMVDLFLMNYLLKGIYKGTKLVLVGDVDQLASVGPGTVLKDLIYSEKIFTVYLDQIFRQAAKSKIILNAHKVNEGEMFIHSENIENKEGLQEDFFFIKENLQEKVLYQLVSLCKERLKNYGNYNFFENIQVLSPTKKGNLGVKELNRILQDKLNEKSENKKEKRSGEIIFREGDKVMQTKNNYELIWEKYGKSTESGTGVFNGELGKIIKIDEKERQVKVKFDDEKIVWYTYSDLEQLEHSYAITIHKAQGSEFDVVIIVIPPAAPVLLTRNLLYTSITRAKKMLIIISSENVIQYMIKNVDTKKRNTGLEYKLKNI